MISEVKNMDCIEYMKQFPDNYFQLAITDPPYGININVSMGRRKGDKKVIIINLLGMILQYQIKNILMNLKGFLKIKLFGVVII